MLSIGVEDDESAVPAVSTAFLVARRGNGGASLHGKAPEPVACVVGAQLGATSSMSFAMRDDMRTVHAVYQLPGVPVVWCRKGVTASRGSCTYTTT